MDRDSLVTIVIIAFCVLALVAFVCDKEPPRAM